MILSETFFSPHQTRTRQWRRVSQLPVWALLAVEGAGITWVSHDITWHDPPSRVISHPHSLFRGFHPKYVRHNIQHERGDQGSHPLARQHVLASKHCPLLHVLLHPPPSQYSPCSRFKCLVLTNKSCHCAPGTCLLFFFICRQCLKDWETLLCRPRPSLHS